jgi:hypothetical protein
MGKKFEHSSLRLVPCAAPGETLIKGRAESIDAEHQLAVQQLVGGDLACMLWYACRMQRRAG